MTADVELLPLPSGNVAHLIAAQAAEIEALRAEVERLNRLLGRIVEGDGDSTTKILFGTDAFAAAREYLRPNTRVKPRREAASA